ncbi:MAG: hypothetical protein WDO13_01780 [Verrucomicrobiota bacterium]
MQLSPTLGGKYWFTGSTNVTPFLPGTFYGSMSIGPTNANAFLAISTAITSDWWPGSTTSSRALGFTLQPSSTGLQMTSYQIDDPTMGLIAKNWQLKPRLGGPPTACAPSAHRRPTSAASRNRIPTPAATSPTSAGACPTPSATPTPRA